MKLREPKLRPPPFLSLHEAMLDIYTRVRGRMSAKTKSLLEGSDLEEMLRMLASLHTNAVLVHKAEARLRAPLYEPLSEDPGPVLLGFQDERLKEPWRLFLLKWDIWVPDTAKTLGGVELFWEGEAEVHKRVLDLLQTLSFQRGELTLYTRLGEQEDRLSFDGETYYRLESDRSNL